MKSIGILRAQAFSPNSNDRTIMEKVADRLRREGFETVLESEDDLTEGDRGDADLYFSMARGEGALHLLDEAEGEGILVVNSPRGVRRCGRPEITRLMDAYDVPRAESIVLELNALNAQYDAPAADVEGLWNEAGAGMSEKGETTSDAVGTGSDADQKKSEEIFTHSLSGWTEFPAWLKRGDSCAQRREDVSFVRNAAELMSAMEDFRRRGIGSAVLSRHLPGDVVKFYGVADTPFFEWYYPTLGHRHSKFGLEEINGPARQFPFDAAALKREADRLATLALTPVYGGDCIVDASGQFRIIDFNDWPSFSSCSDRAAEAIVSYLFKHIQKYGKR